jgi:excisionase family DNA binding protein
VHKSKLLYSTTEACEALGIRKTKLFALMRDGVIERRQLGARTVIPAEALQAFAANLPRITSAPAEAATPAAAAEQPAPAVVLPRIEPAPRAARRPAPAAERPAT